MFEQTTTFMAVCYGLALNTRLFCRAMQLRLNRLVFRASCGQPQFSTMTECRHNQWAGKQAPDNFPHYCAHCLQEQRMPSQKNFKTAHLQVQL